MIITTRTPTGTPATPITTGPAFTWATISGALPISPILIIQAITGIQATGTTTIHGTIHTDITTLIMEQATVTGITHTMATTHITATILTGTDITMATTTATGMDITAECTTATTSTATITNTTIMTE